MQLLKVSKKHSRLSDALYILLNIGLALAVWLVVVFVQNLWVPILLVTLSKWRVFAVRPRYWKANLLTNLVDYIVGVGVVVLLYQAADQLIFQGILTLAYCLWLLVIKPRSKRSFILAQSGVSLFVGVSALASLAYEYDILFVFGVWVIAYSVARHVLSHYEEENSNILSLAWAFVSAQIAWVSFWWLGGYPIPGAPSVIIPQVAVILLVVGFLVERVYTSKYKKDHVSHQDILAPSVFSGILLVVLLTVFNTSI